MAYTTQYIGSRYVPLFAEPAEWNSARTYEPLTIVMHDGNSYTSRQYVPTGIEITNEKFWALTGNYNAQVERYRQEVKAFDGRIDANATAIANEVTRAKEAEQNNATAIANEVTRAKEAEQNNATAIANEVTRAKEAEQTNATAIANEVTRAKEAEQTNATDIATNAANIQKNTTDIANMQHRNFILLGDSFGGGLHPVSEGTYEGSEYGWVNYCKSHHPASVEHVYTSSDAGQAIKVGNFGFGSSSPWIDAIKAIHDNVVTDASTITDIVVLGGSNDRPSDSLYGAIYSFIDYTKQAFPNAMVKIGCLGSNLRDELLAIYNTYKDACVAGTNQAIFLPQTFMLFNDFAYVSSDRVHLTVDGYKKYASTIYDIVYNNLQTYDFEILIDDMQVPEGYTKVVKDRIVMESNDIGVSYTLRGLDTALPIKITIPGEKWNSSYLPIFINIHPNYMPNQNFNLLLNGYVIAHMKDGTTKSGYCNMAYDGLSTIYSYNIAMFDGSDPLNLVNTFDIIIPIQQYFIPGKAW